MSHMEQIKNSCYITDMVLFRYILPITSHGKVDSRQLSGLLLMPIIDTIIGDPVLLL